MVKITRFAVLPVRLSAASALLGVYGIFSSAMDSETLGAIVPGRPPMQLVTAILTLLAAAAAMLQYGERPGLARRVSARVLAALVLVVGVLIFAEYLLDADLGVDWRLTDRPSRHPHPGRASPVTAAVFVGLGAAMLLRDAARPRVVGARIGCSLMALFLAFVSLVAHAFGAGFLYRLAESDVIGVALPTALALTALSSAVLIERQDAEALRLLSAPGPGGILLRRLGLTALIAGPALGASLLGAAQALGLADLPLILALGNVAAVSLALWLLLRTALPLERAHQALERSETRQRELVELAPVGIFIADQLGKYTDVNAAGCRLLSFEREEILGKTIMDFIPTDDVQRLWRSHAEMKAGAVHIGEWKLRQKGGTYVPVEVTAKVLPDGRWQGFVRDITERLELERELRESRDFLQEVLESATEYGIIAEDLERRVALWNAGARRTYGYDREEICGRTSDMLVGESEIAAWRALHAHAMQQGSAEGMILARRKGGGSFAANVVCTRQVGANGQMRGFLVVSRDLTAEQRHLAEQEFLARVGVELAACLDYGETLKRVLALVTSFLGDIAAIDVVKDGRVERAHVLHRRPEDRELAGAIKRLGAARGPGHPLWRVIQDRQPLLLPHIDEEQRNGFASSPEHGRVLRAVRATSAMLVPLTARDELLAVLSISACNGSRTYGPSDLRLAVELSRRAALALDNAQMFQQLRLQGAVTTNLAEGAVVIRAEDAIIVYANRRFEALFGYAAGELVGKRVDVLNAGAEPLQTADAIIGELKRSGEWHGEVRNVRKDRSEFWSAASVSTFEHEEHGPVWIAVHMDVTERKLLEEKNAQALRDKEVLMKEMHHRVKNNLQIISSLFSLQKERTHSAELRALLDESRTRVQSISLVHEQLYRSPELAAIDFDEYLRSLVGAIRSTYGAHGVSCEVSAKGVVLDLEQAVPCALLVSELVSNALKHAFPSGAHGTLSVRAGARDGVCTVEVADDGPGIPADFDWTKTRSLGLRLVRSLTRQLRGQIEVDCARGTHVYVRFPIASRGAELAMPATPTTPAAAL